MSDFEERLRAADPAAVSRYEHPDVHAMISRIMAHSPRARHRVLRSFQVRMAGSVALAAALTVGGIAALDGAAPSLSVFALAAPTHGGVPASTKANSSAAPGYSTAQPASGMMRIYEEFNFTAGPNLSVDAGAGAAYQLQLPTNTSDEVARIAGIFNVAGAPVSPNNDTKDYTVTDPSGAYVEYQTYNTVPQWSYSVALQQGTSSTTSDGTTVAMPSHATVESDVQRYLGQLGYGYQVSDPQFSSSNNVTTSPDGVSVTTNEESVTYSVLVNGVVTDQSFQFAVDQNNNVLSAGGPAFQVLPAVNYPLQSPVAGVAVLEAQQQSYFATNGSPDQSSGTGTVGPSAGSGPSTPVTPPSATSDSSGATDTTTTTPSGPPIVDVTLDADTIAYQTYQLTDGSVWMLPIYDYTGLVQNSDGSTYTGTWSTIAVDPTFIHISNSSSGGVNPGGPIMY